MFRWVQRYASELDKRCRPYLTATNDSYRVDETYIKIKKQWYYLYRAVDSAGQTIDFLLSKIRDATAAERFFRKALRAQHTATPWVITVDKNAAYPPAFTTLQQAGQLPASCTLRQCKYLNNVVEIVFTQLTKTAGFTAGSCRDGAADFHITISDQDPIDQEFDQGPLLLECGLG